MGTCNYITQSDFDLYTVEYKSLSEEEIEDFIIETGDIYDEELERQVFYEDEYRQATQLADELNRELMFYQIEIRSGYYDGLQTIIYGTDWQYSFYNIQELDNKDCHYFFDMCKSKVIRKHKAEVNKINKKLLPLFKKELGFDHVRCIGVFSSGEAIYERVK